MKFSHRNSLATHSFTHAIPFDCIIVVDQYMHRHVRDVITVIDKQWWSMGRQKGSELHHWNDFLHNYYTFESVHDGDNDGVVKMFVGLSCQLWGLFILHYVEHIFPTRSVMLAHQNHYPFQVHIIVHCTNTRNVLIAMVGCLSLRLRYQ